MKNYMPLRKHKNRDLHLYLVNYHAHAAKRWLSLWVKKWSDKIPEKSLIELIDAANKIRILDDYMQGDQT